jgi:hypothetical protein
MKHELKIIMSYETEGIDCDEDYIVHKTVISLDNKPIGAVQDIKFHASTEQIIPSIEITFPDLFSEDIDSSYQQTALPRELKKTLDILKNMSNVKVILSKLDWDK